MTPEEAFVLDYTKIDESWYPRELVYLLDLDKDVPKDDGRRDYYSPDFEG